MDCEDPELSSITSTYLPALFKQAADGMTIVIIQRLWLEEETNYSLIRRCDIEVPVPAV